MVDQFIRMGKQPVSIDGVLTEEPREYRDWSFGRLKRSETLWGPHGYHRYPAKFIPQLVRRIIETYSSPGSLVGDPFLGSGTTGIEALRAGRRFCGSDISPVALIISKAKCVPIRPSALETTWVQLKQQIEKLPQVGRRGLNKAEKRCINNIEIARASAEERLAYWFPNAHRHSLELLLAEILELPRGAKRTFFLCAFSNILRSCSIWLSGSTKPQKDLSKVLADPIEAFEKQVNRMIHRNQIYYDGLVGSGNSLSAIRGLCSIKVEDARALSVEDAELDLLVTSPPYATCYEYADIHQLTRLWFEKYRIIRANNLRAKLIGSKMLLSHDTQGNSAFPSFGSEKVDDALRRLVGLLENEKQSGIKREALALHQYFQDMKDVLSECARVVRKGKYFVLIIGDSYRRGIKIPTSDAISEMASTMGFDIEKRIVRKVPARILVSTRDKKTGRFSSTRKNNVQVYPHENILVFRRSSS